MSNSKITWIINIALKLCIIVVLIVGASTKQQYSYYIFLRWFVMLSFIYLSYRAYEQKNIGLFIYFLGVAIIFNSFHKFTFQRATWHLIDNLVAFITSVIVIIDFKGMMKKSR